MQTQSGKANITSVSVVLVIAAIAIFLGISFQQELKQQQSGQLDLAEIRLLPKPKNIADIDLINHLNQTMSINDFKGKWSLLFFGFTHCPDVCPSTMQSLKTIKQNVAKKLSSTTGWGNYQVVFVSVDPERDTPEQLANYVPYFDGNFIGLTSTPETIKQLAQQFGVPYAPQPADQQGNYEVDHYAGILLLNPETQLAGLISAPLNINAITEDLVKLAQHYPNDHQQTIQLVSKQAPLSQAVSSQTSNTTFDTQVLQLEQAWIRPAPPNAPSMVAYGELRNTSDQAITIQSALSPEFGMVMIHDTVINNDIATMVHNETLTIPAQSSIMLKPKAKHIMLMRPKRELLLNDSAKIQFIDKTDRTFTMVIPVREAPAPAPAP